MRRLAPTLLLTALLPACTGGEGNISIRVDGEDASREGIPGTHDHDEGEDHEHGADLADGWEIEFSRYLVSLRDIEIADTSGNTAFRSDAVYIYDLAAGAPEIELANVEAQRWDRVGWSIVVPAASDAQMLGEGVSEEDVQAMIDSGASYLIEGHAHHEGKALELDFSFAIDASAELSDCTNGTDDTQGIVVSSRSTADAVLTFHVEHLLFTDLAAEGSDLRFEAVAAMANADGQISFDALANQSLADLRDADGDPLLDEMGNPVIYDPGGVSLAENTLAAFITEALRSQAHLNGEGLCTISSL